MEEFRGVPPPDKLPSRVIEAVYATLAKPLDVTWLDGTPVGLMVHWVSSGDRTAGRTLICEGDKTCARCRDGGEAHWVGYLAAYEHRRRCRVAVTLSLRTWETLKSVIPLDEPLRGLRTIMARTEGRANGPVGVKIADSAPLRPLMASPDLLPTLRALYGVGIETWIPSARKPMKEVAEA